jgi:signal transduction histidine kinase/CheY-like chemotaxis protein
VHAEDKEPGSAGPMQTAPAGPAPGHDRPFAGWPGGLIDRLAAILTCSTGDARLAGRVRAAQVRAIVRLTPLAMTASSLNALLLVLTLWHIGELQVRLIVWASLVILSALYYGRTWMAGGERDPERPASCRAIRRAVLHGVLFGSLWGAVPAMLFPGGSGQVQLLVGCITAGMMCAGAFVLGTVPLAALASVAMMLAGSAYALLSDGVATIHLVLIALMVIYAAVIVGNLVWNAHLFVEHFLAEARLKDEIGARERAQAQVAHAQRITALGELAGGIAHDFNNILQSIACNASLAAAAAHDPEQVARHIDSILSAAERGGSIGRRLLAFARQDTLHAEPLALSHLLAGVDELLRRSLTDTIRLQIDAPADLPRMLADRAQLETIIVNLANNARDAMPQGGTLTLRAGCESVGKEWSDPKLAAGRYVRLEFADTGIGMDGPTLARCVDPFFTTKPGGRGTGLGLSMAKGFAEQSGGAFRVLSEAGCGTEVTLWLPHTDEPMRLPTQAPAVPPRASDDNAGRHVLVVDDEPAVRETMVEILEGSGFAVSSAGDGTAALELMRRGAQVDLVVADFSMPRMNGVEFIAAARTLRPSLAAILLTGHVGDVGTGWPEPAGPGSFVLLQKPIGLAVLIEQIERLLRLPAALQA